MCREVQQHKSVETYQEVLKIHACPQVSFDSIPGLFCIITIYYTNLSRHIKKFSKLRALVHLLHKATVYLLLTTQSLYIIHTGCIITIYYTNALYTDF